MIFATKKFTNEEIEKLISFENSEEKLFVVPTNRKARALKKELLYLGKLEFKIETLTTLTYKLLSKVKTFQLLDDTTRGYLLRRATKELQPVYFTKFEGDAFPKGTLDKISSVISEYKRYGITPDKLLEEVKDAGLEEAEINKATDIARIYENFNQYSRKLGVLELGDIYSELFNVSEDLLTDIFAETFGKIKVMIFQYFTEFSRYEIDLIRKIAGATIPLVFIFPNIKNERLLKHFDKTFTLLQESNFIKLTSELPKANPVSEHLAKNLYSFKPNKINAENISIFSGKDNYEEIENIAKQIKDLLEVEKVKPNNIAVVFNLINDYSPIVRTVFDEFGIPLNLSDRLTLDKSPVVKSLLTFLRILKDNFYYKTLFSAINSPYFFGVIENPYLLQKFAQDNTIIANKNTWLETIENIEVNESDEKKVNKIKSIKKDFNTILNLLHPFDKELPPRQFLFELKKFAKRIHIEKKLISLIPEKAEENITALSRWFESIENIFNLVLQEYGNDFKGTFKFYFDIIESVASWTRFNVKERSGYGVLVTSIDEIRGLMFDYLFVGGLNDGILPLKYAPEIFFAKNFMTKEEEKLAEQRYFFYIVFEAFNKKIFLSFSETSDKKELAKSVFLSDLQRCTDVNFIPRDYFATKIYSQRELLINHKILNGITDLDFEEIKLKEEAYLQRKENAETIFNGYLLSDDDTFINEKIIKFSDGVFSVSQFENYAKCPFKYFVERILELEPLEEPEKDIEPILIGNYLHEVFFEFYTKLKKDNIDIHSNKAEKLLFEIGQKLYDKFSFGEETYFYEREKFFGVKGNKYDSIFYKFLENERGRENYVPSYFEVSFGRKTTADEKVDENLSVRETFSIEGVKISGKIDRVDLHGKKIAVIDYKSGSKNVTFKSINEGIDLQLPIYLKIFNRMLGEDYEPGMIAIYTLKFGESKFGLHPVKNRTKELSSDDLKDLTDVASGFVKDYHYKIASGVFTPSNWEKREDGVCKYCQFRSICRIDERE